jgi:hypothetical protein
MLLWNSMNYYILEQTVRGVGIDVSYLNGAIILSKSRNTVKRKSWGKTGGKIEVVDFHKEKRVTR